MPHLTRSGLHRLFQRHGISRLPDLKAGAEPKRAFKDYPIGYFHIDIAEVRTEEGKLHLFVAVDRTSKFAFARLEDRADTKAAVAFLNSLVEVVPYHIHTVLTDNGIQFADLPRNRQKPTALRIAQSGIRKCHYVCPIFRTEPRRVPPNIPPNSGGYGRISADGVELNVL